MAPQIIILLPCSFRTHQIRASPTSSAGDGFKANLVFKEIEKKLEEVRFYTNLTGRALKQEGVDMDFRCHQEVVIQAEIFILLPSLKCISDI